MSRIIFNLAAKCDAAGRSQNEDNYWVCPDLTKWDAPTENVVGTDEDVELSEKGALLVVADGMGGMNAGEVASKLVIEGIKKKFSNIPDSLLSNEAEIMSFIHSAIVESDKSIKKYAKEHREAEGLGSTIVLLWLLNGRAYCGWCGDSRIYRFNPNNELVRLSHDHSYVQSLVDEGKISEEEAFDHPDGNIISKALGDNGNEAEPEIRVYDVYSRDVFLLCSDGLCGLLQDSEINDVIQDTCTSSKDSLHALWKKGEKTGWSDNATIDLLCVVDGGKPAKGRPDGYPKIARKIADKKDSNRPQIVSGGDSKFAKFLKPPYLYLLAFLAICFLSIALYNTFGPKEDNESTNHEFNIEVPENNGNTNVNSDTDTNTQGSGSSNANNQGSHNNNHVGGGRNNGQSNQNAGHGGNQTNNNNANNHNNQNGQQQNENNQNNTPINQGVINQLPQNGNNSNGQTNQQPSQQRPSDDYMSLLNSTRNDYYNISRNVWPVVLREGNIEDSERSQIQNFIKNVKHLTASDNPSFKCLDSSYKRELSTWQSFARTLESRLPSIPRVRGNGQSGSGGNNNPYNHNNNPNNPYNHNNNPNNPYNHNNNNNPYNHNI